MKCLINEWDGFIGAYPDKTQHASLVNNFKNIPEKRVSMELITMMLCESWNLAYEKKVIYEIIMQENQISHVFRNFPVYERH